MPEWMNVESPITATLFLASAGFTGLWLIGLWERSPASARIKQICGNPEAAASAYSLDDYEIANELGGWEALDNLRALGDCEIHALVDAVPTLGDLDPEQSYLAWDIRLATTARESEIRDVFCFIEGDCDLGIAPVRQAATATWYVEFQATPALLAAPGAFDTLFLELSGLGSHHVLESPPAGDEPQPGRWRLKLETSVPRERIEDAFAFAFYLQWRF